MQNLSAPSPLSELRDIHPPVEVSVWPLSWGWYVAASLVLVIVAAVIITAVKRYRFNRARRQVIDELNAVTAQDPRWPTTLNTLLKRLALSYFPYADVAHLYGEKWLAFLLNTLRPKVREDVTPGLTVLLQQNYVKTPSSSEFDTCLVACKTWVKKSELAHGASKGATNA